VALIAGAGAVWSAAGTGYKAEPRDNKEKSPALPEAVVKQTKPIFDGKSLDGWVQIPSDSWEVKDGAMASKGAGRGVIYTKDDYKKYRLVYVMRHVSGNPDHQACVLIFCTRPEERKKPLDALGGIQFQPPNGGHWDYRPGQNKAGMRFTSHQHAKFKPDEWFQVEMLVDATAGTARMAVAQPVGAKAVEVLSYTGPRHFNLEELFDSSPHVPHQATVPAMNRLEAHEALISELGSS
jgi:hypothetical protein